MHIPPTSPAVTPPFKRMVSHFFVANAMLLVGSRGSPAFEFRTRTLRRTVPQLTGGLLMISRRCPKTVGPLVLICACALYCGNPALATSLQKMSDPQMVRAAGLIVEGKVTSVRSEWNQAHNQIYTFVEIEIRDTLKGALPGNVVRLRVLGGRVGDEAMTLVDAPAFEQDEEAVFFLHPNHQSLFPIIGFNQGKLQIETEADTERRVVKKRGVGLDEFKVVIRDLVRAQSEAQQNDDAAKEVQP